MDKITEIERLQKHSDQLYQLIASATQTYLLARALSEKNENDYALDINFIVFHEFLYIKNTIIELHKLLSDSNGEQYNIHKYLRSIELNKKIFTKLTSQKISEWKKNLEKHNLLIAEISNLRSKYYAHVDKNYQTFVSSASDKIEFTNFEDLFSALQSFYIESNLILYNTITGFKTAISVDYFNQILDKHKKLNNN